MVGFIRKILSWLLSFFKKSETPELDGKIEQKKKNIKEIDKELKKKYDNVKDGMKEWK